MAEVLGDGVRAEAERREMASEPAYINVAELGRMVQRASVVSSICDKVSEERPIFKTRLVDDNGARITGVPATPGNCPTSVASLSCTS
mgnify:CR=1 FL=1